MRNRKTLLILLALLVAFLLIGTIFIALSSSRGGTGGGFTSEFQETEDCDYEDALKSERECSKRQIAAAKARQARLASPRPTPTSVRSASPRPVSVSKAPKATKKATTTTRAKTCTGTGKKRKCS